jgi:hypothetical protein
MINKKVGNKLSNKARKLFGVLFIVIIVLPFLYIERTSISGILGSLLLFLMAYATFFKN